MKRVVAHVIPRLKLLAGTVAVVALALVFHPAAEGSDWTATPVPSQTKVEAASPVWFRCFVRVPDNMAVPAQSDLWRDSVTLSLGGMGRAFSVYLDGQKIADSPAIADGQRRRFKVPKGIFEKSRFNVLAIRLESGGVGLGLAPILAGYFDELPLEGAWEMAAGEVDPASLKAVGEKPEKAVFTEAGFHPAATPLAPTEFMRGAKLPRADALAKMRPAADLTVDLVLSEPEVAQPTQITFDERGRMWVSQYRQYPYPAGLTMISRDKYYRAKFDRVPLPPPHNEHGRDRITVHESTHGDGVYDKTTVALDGLNMANSALFGHGGLWVMNTPYLLFYPVTDADGLPHGDPEVRLAGFGLEDAHSVANGLTWGPDGWLYGAQGSTTTSHVVRPGIDPPDFPGVYREGCMVWRYHPEKKIYEVFDEGGGNVFELDFDGEGRLFSGHNGGDTRGFHYVEGGFHLKQGRDPAKFGPSENAFAFGYLDQMKSRNPIARFSHAIIVADGTAIPSRYQGAFFAADPLHRDIVVAERYPHGSTFETSDSGKALASDDPSFRPVYVTNGPDGAIYVADFCEEFIAHGQHYQGQIDPDSGRIYRIRGKDAGLDKETNLAAKTDAELIALLDHPSKWHRQTAVRLLGERRNPACIAPLRNLMRTPAVHPALESLWALYQMGALDESTALEALKHSAAPVRTWVIRLMGDEKQMPAKFAQALLDLAKTEPDAEVRSQIASTSRRLPAQQGLALVAALLQRDTDAADPYIPLLCWWTIVIHCSDDREAVLQMLPWETKITREQILGRLMRRFASTGTRTDLLTCARLLGAAPDEGCRKLLMAGFEEAFKGRALPPLPDELIEALAKSGLASPHLRVRLREPKAIADAMKTAADPKQKLEERLLCVRLFGEVKLPETEPTLLSLAISAEQPELQKAALNSLLLYDDEVIGEKIAAALPRFSQLAQTSAVSLLTSRTPWTLALLKQIKAGTVPAAAVPVEIAAQLKDHHDNAISELAQSLFKPQIRPPSGERLVMIDRVRALLAAGAGDPYKGQPIFEQRCAVCHTLFHKGGKIGPDLTSYQRDDLGTLLTSIIDPSAEIREGYRNQIISTTDGRMLSGILTEGDASVLVLRGLDGQDINIPRAQVREQNASDVSIMPEGLLLGLSDQELRDFFAYLRIAQPINK